MYVVLVIWVTRIRTVPIGMGGGSAQRTMIPEHIGEGGWVSGVDTGEIRMGLFC